MLRDQNHRSFLTRALASGLAAVYLFTNVVAAHATDSTIWGDRRRAAQARFKSTANESRALYAQLPQNILTAPDLSAVLGQVSPQTAVNSADLGKAVAKTTDRRILDVAQTIMPYGNIRFVCESKKSGAPLILHIQDLHGNLDVQENAAKMIRSLAEQGGVTLVGLEGAEGSFTLDDVRRYPDKEIQGRVAHFFLKKDLIAAGEYAALTSSKPLTLWGLEDMALYRENVAAVKESLANGDRATRYLAQLLTALETGKTALYSEDLKEYDRSFVSYQEGRQGLGAYVRTLFRLRSKCVKNTADRFPNLEALRAALNTEESLDFKAVERDRLLLAQTLADKLSKPALEALVQESVDYRMGRRTHAQYNRYLESLCVSHGIGWDSISHLKSYIAYVAQADSIHRDDLLTELSTLERLTQQGLAHTPDQRSLVSLSSDAQLLKKLLGNELSPDEWKTFVARRSDILRFSDRLASVKTANDPRVDLAAFLIPFERFCSRAMDRNEALAAHLLVKMAETKSTTAVLVAGGFHTEGLVSRLKSQGASVLVLTPKIDKPIAESHYLNAFARDPLPLEKIFTGEPISLITERGLADAGPSLLKSRLHVANLAAYLADLREKLIGQGASLGEIRKSLADSLSQLKRTVGKNLQSLTPQIFVTKDELEVFTAAGNITVDRQGRGTASFDGEFKGQPHSFLPPSTVAGFFRGLGLSQRTAVNVAKFVVAFVIPAVETVLYGLLAPEVAHLLAADPAGIGLGIALLAPTLVGLVSGLVHVGMWTLQGEKVTRHDFLIWWGGATLFSLPFTLFPLLGWSAAFQTSLIPHALLNPAVVYGITGFLGRKQGWSWLENLKPASLLLPPGVAGFQDRLLIFIVTSLQLLINPVGRSNEIILTPVRAILERLRGRSPPSPRPSTERDLISQGIVDEIARYSSATPNPISPECLSRVLSGMFSPNVKTGMDIARLFAPREAGAQSDITKAFPNTLTFGIEIEFQLDKQRGERDTVLEAVNAIIQEFHWPPVTNYSGNFKEASSIVLHNTREDWDKLKALLTRLQGNPLSQGVYSVHMHVGKEGVDQSTLAANEVQVGRVGKAFEAMWRALSGRGYARPGGNLQPLGPGSLTGRRTTIHYHDSIINLSGRYPTIEVKIISGLLNENGHLPVEDLEDQLWFVFALFTAATHETRRYPLVQMGRPVIAGEKPSPQQIESFLDHVFGDWDPHGRRLAEGIFQSLETEPSGWSDEELQGKQAKIKEVYREAGLVLVYDLHDQAEGHIDAHIVEHLLAPNVLSNLAEDLVRSGATDEQALVFFPPEMFVPLLEALAVARLHLTSGVRPDPKGFAKAMEELSPAFLSRDPRLEFGLFLQQERFSPRLSARVSGSFTDLLDQRISLDQFRTELSRIPPPEQIFFNRRAPLELLFHPERRSESIRIPLFPQIRPLETFLGSIRIMLGLGFSKTSLTGAVSGFLSLTFSTVTLALFLPGFISTGAYLLAVLSSFAFSVVGIFSSLGYGNFLESIRLGRRVAQNAGTEDRRPSDQVRETLVQRFPGHSADIKEIVVVSKVVEVDASGRVGAYRLSEDGATLEVKQRPGRGADQYVKNAHFDPLNRTLFVLENAARSTPFALGTVLAHEIGKKEFARQKFQKLILHNARVAELFGNVYELLFLLRFPLPRFNEGGLKRIGIWSVLLLVLALSFASQLWNPTPVDSPQAPPERTAVQRMANPQIAQDKSDGAYISALFDAIKKAEGLAGIFQDPAGFIEAIKRMNGPAENIEDLRKRDTISYPKWPMDLQFPGEMNKKFSSAQPKSLSGTRAAAVTWGIAAVAATLAALAGLDSDTVHGLFQPIIAIAGFFSIGAWLDYWIGALFNSHGEEYGLIPEFALAEDLPGHSTVLALNVNGNLTQVNKERVSHIPLWYQRYLLHRETFVAQKFGLIGDALSHAVIDPLLLGVHALRAILFPIPTITIRPLEDTATQSLEESLRKDLSGGTAGPVFEPLEQDIHRISIRGATRSDTLASELNRVTKSSTSDSLSAVLGFLKGRLSRLPSGPLDVISLAQISNETNDFAKTLLAASALAARGWDESGLGERVVGLPVDQREWDDSIRAALAAEIKRGARGSAQNPERAQRLIFLTAQGTALTAAQMDRRLGGLLNPRERAWLLSHGEVELVQTSGVQFADGKYNARAIQSTLRLNQPTFAGDPAVFNMERMEKQWVVPIFDMAKLVRKDLEQLALITIQA